MGIFHLLTSGIRRSKFIKKNKTSIEEIEITAATHLHMDKISVVIQNIIIENENTRTFVLKYEGALPVFKAGMYIDVYNENIQRSYSLISTNKDALEGIYKITVKMVDNGKMCSFLFSRSISDTLTISSPKGEFCYSKIRDYGTVIGIAGGSGITPFLAMAKAIFLQEESFKLILIYGVNTKNDILHFEELEELKKNPNIQIEYVIANESIEGYSYGLINKDILKKYITGNESIFVCGPSGMVTFIQSELKEFHLERKQIRYEIQSSILKNNSLEHNLIIYQGPNEFHGICNENSSLLKAIENMGIYTRSSCRGGICGLCRSKLISGEVMMNDHIEGRRYSDERFYYIHPCISYPKTDIVLEIPDIKKNL